MKIKRSIVFICIVIFTACSQAPIQSAAEDDAPHKVSRDYEAIGDATGIRPYVYGKRTLIKFDAGKPSFMSIKDEQGASVAYRIQGGYYILDRKLDSFTVSGSGRLVQFNRIQAETPIDVAQNFNDVSAELELDVLAVSENSAIPLNANQKIKTSDPIYAIMYKQMQQHRKLLNIASANPQYTGEELFQINSRLDLIEYKIANQNEAIVHVYFPFNNTVFDPESELVNALLPIAKDALRINILGRTDSRIPDEGNRKIANGRVVTAKNFLVKHGVPENIIHTSPRASGDFIAPTGMEEGRKLNRRVTIEVIMQ